ncbi:hypothetical protein ACOSQ2_014622 [Xanthoceras sorbifolium]
MRARESPITFEELHDKRIEHEASLKRDENRFEYSHITVNYARGKGSQFENNNNQGHNNRSQNSSQFDHTNS